MPNYLVRATVQVTHTYITEMEVEDSRDDMTDTDVENMILEDVAFLTDVHDVFDPAFDLDLRESDLKITEWECI